MKATTYFDGPLGCATLLALACVAYAQGNPASRIEARARRLYPDTALVLGGKPAAIIVYPHGRAEYEAMARKIRAAVESVTGGSLEAVPDTVVTEKRHPVLRKEYRRRNLILLGRLGINRAIWGVYNRFLCAVDGYYPGKGGYVVRTAANVYSNGANTIIVGSSDETGVERAVEVFLEIVKRARFANGNLILPWLLEVELRGQCKDIFDADEKRQMARKFREPGHREILS